MDLKGLIAIHVDRVLVSMFKFKNDYTNLT